MSLERNPKKLPIIENISFNDFSLFSNLSQSQITNIVAIL
jgi:hypothetical protein